MITVENIAANIVKITVPEQKLKVDDFVELTPQIDALIREQGMIRLLIDASKFHGWEDKAAFEKHMSFVKFHHQSVERVAAIAGFHWIHWLAGVVNVFVYPDIEIFNVDETDKALKWVTE